MKLSEVIGSSGFPILYHWPIRLDGLHLDHAQCPPEEFMLLSISLCIYDCISEPSSDMLEQYGVIYL